MATSVPISPDAVPPAIRAKAEKASLSWAMTEYLISAGRIGCVPGADFGANGEGCIRFCFARDRRELIGALDSMKALFHAARPAAVVEGR